MAGKERLNGGHSPKCIVLQAVFWYRINYKKVMSNTYHQLPSITMKLVNELLKTHKTYHLTRESIIFIINTRFRQGLF